MIELSATQIRYEQARAEMKRAMFNRDPEALMEAVATHYASLASMAMMARKALETKRHGRMSGILEMNSTDEFLAMVRRKIVEIHIADFGVPPSWDHLDRPT